jgi:hypothetical protein
MFGMRVSMCIFCVVVLNFGCANAANDNIDDGVSISYVDVEGIQIKKKLKLEKVEILKQEVHNVLLELIFLQSMLPLVDDSEKRKILTKIEDLNVKIVNYRSKIQYIENHNGSDDVVMHSSCVKANIKALKDDSQKLVVNFFTSMVGGNDVCSTGLSDGEFYYIDLAKNRNYIEFIYHEQTFGVLTSPLKLRSFNKVSTDTSVLGYYSWKRGTQRYTYYRGYEDGLGAPLAYGFALAGGFGTGKVKISGVESNIGFVSLGMGFLFSMSIVDLGVLVGYDFGFGQGAKSWEYGPMNKDYKPWVGFVLGAKLF